MRRIRIAAATVMATAGLIGAVASPASAAPPFHFHDTNSEFEPHFTTCDGQVISLFTTGTTSGTTFFDTNGDVTRTIVHNRFLDHFTNTVTGETLLNRGTFQETFIAIPGSDEFTETITGHVFLATQPGSGIVVHDSGRVVLSPDEDVIFAAGHHAELVNGQFEELLCDALT